MVMHLVKEAFQKFANTVTVIKNPQIPQIKEMQPLQRPLWVTGHHLMPPFHTRGIAKPTACPPLHGAANAWAFPPKALLSPKRLWPPAGGG